LQQRRARHVLELLEECGKAKAMYDSFGDASVILEMTAWAWLTI